VLFPRWPRDGVRIRPAGCAPDPARGVTPRADRPSSDVLDARSRATSPGDFVTAAENACSSDSPRRARSICSRVVLNSITLAEPRQGGGTASLQA